MIVDAHHHIWKLDRGDYGWLEPELTPLYRDFDLEDWKSEQDSTIQAGILVQAAPTVAETEFLLQSAESVQTCLGVVGWVDFETDGPTQTERLCTNHGLLGLRPMIQDIPDDQWMLQQSVQPTFHAMTQLGLIFDALVFPRHLPHLLRLLDQHPELQTIIDHAAKPPIAEIHQADGDPSAHPLFQSWKRGLAQLATRPLVHCKLSGLVTEAGQHPTTEALRPFVETLLELFGPERLLWGSDWPVVHLGGGPQHWWETANQLTQQLNPQERQAVFGENARRLYAPRS